MTASFRNMNGAVFCHFFAIKTCFLPHIMIYFRSASTWGVSCVVFEINFFCLKFIPNMPNLSLPSVNWHFCLKVESSLEPEPEVDQCPLLISDWLNRKPKQTVPLKASRSPLCHREPWTEIQETCMIYFMCTCCYLEM